MFRFAYFSYEYREVDYQQNAFLFNEKLLNRTFCVAVKLVVHGLICTDLEESSCLMDHAVELRESRAARRVWPPRARGGSLSKKVHELSSTSVIVVRRVRVTLLALRLHLQ